MRVLVQIERSVLLIRQSYALTTVCARLKTAAFQSRTTHSRNVIHQQKTDIYFGSDRFPLVVEWYWEN